MNNQAAQTIPERTYMTRDEALKIARACAYAKCHTHDYLPRTAQEAADWQPHEWVLDAIRWNALSQTAGVVVSDEMIERACKDYAFRVDGALWPDAYDEHEVLALRAQMREFLLNAIGAAPSASGIHPDALPDGTLSKSTAKRVEALAAASVSERARVSKQVHDMLIDLRAAASIGRPITGDELHELEQEILRALEQALTQQRGEREDAHKFRRLAQLLDGFDFRLGRNALMPPATYLDSVEITCEFQPGIGQSVIDAIVDVLATEKRND